MVIPAGKTVVIDVDTPILKMLLIQGRDHNIDIAYTSTVSNMMLMFVTMSKILLITNTEHVKI